MGAARALAVRRLRSARGTVRRRGARICRIRCLAVLPDVPLRLAVFTIILGAAVSLLCGVHPRWRDSIVLRLGTGLASGFMSGLSAIGGMIAATMLFTTSLPAAALRG